jgi:hypothetical protein
MTDIRQFQRSHAESCSSAATCVVCTTSTSHGA